jgi:hypothetical protein
MTRACKQLRATSNKAASTAGFFNLPLAGKLFDCQAQLWQTDQLSHAGATGCDRPRCRISSRQREPKLSHFLSSVPLWIAAILLVVLPTSTAMCGPVLIRHRIGLERLATNNEIAGSPRSV